MTLLQRLRLLNSQNFLLTLFCLPLAQAKAAYHPWSHNFADFKVTADIPQQLYDIELHLPLVSKTASNPWIPFLQAELRSVSQETNAMQPEKRRLLSSGGLGLHYRYAPEGACGIHLFLDYDATLKANRPSIGLSYLSTYGSAVVNFYRPSDTEAIDNQKEITRVLAKGWDIHINLQLPQFRWINLAIVESYYAGHLAPYDLDGYIPQPGEKRQVKRKNHVTQLGLDIRPIPCVTVSPSWSIGRLEGSKFSITASFRYRLGVPIREQFLSTEVPKAYNFQQRLLSIVPRAKHAPLAYALNPSAGVPHYQASEAQLNRQLHSFLTSLLQDPKTQAALKRKSITFSDYLEKRNGAVLIKKPFDTENWKTIFLILNSATHADKQHYESKTTANEAFIQLGNLKNLLNSLNSIAEKEQLVNLKKLDQLLNQRRIVSSAYFRVLPNATYFVSPHSFNQVSSPHYSRVLPGDSGNLKKKNELAEQESIQLTHFMKIKERLNKETKDFVKTDTMLESTRKLILFEPSENEKIKSKEQFSQALSDFAKVIERLPEEKFLAGAKLLEVISEGIRTAKEKKEETSFRDALHDLRTISMSFEKEGAAEGT